MTATYACNWCQGIINPADAREHQRQLGAFAVTVYSGSSKLDADRDSTHLCTACVCKVLTDGTRVTTDEIPF